MKEWSIEFLKSILETNMEINDVAHESADFLAGLAGVIMAISLTQVFSATGLTKLGFIVISITGFIVVFFSIGVVRPRIGRGKVNLMYYKGLLNIPKEKYTKHIQSIINNEKKIVDEFCNEIYELSIELKAKFRMIRLGADILAVGLIVGLLLIFIS